MEAMRELVFVFTIQLGLLGCAHATTVIKPVGCDFNPRLQAQRSAELVKIAAEDQADRDGSYDSIDWNKVSKKDLKRRIRVATIFAEGCFLNASDYASAAIVYQHGVTADHFYQAFVWANHAVKMGDASQRWLTAAALDRYLVKIGQKQLFGTQLSRSGDGKWCIQPVERAFPEAIRMEYVKLSVKDQIARVLKGIGSDQSSEDVLDCEPALKPSPQGTVPGFW
ncbi:MAG: hypothetical protein NDI61_11835 [Bdellovibrionaceae bacterium]|nr:hypothetical protein [Pseudobdellovibrionaceae bacterium]